MDKKKDITKAIVFIHRYSEYLRKKKDYEWADQFRSILELLGYKVENKKIQEK